MELQRVSKEILSQLIDITRQLKPTDFAQPLSILSGNTVGKHIRHIVEFFDLMLAGRNGGIVNYDKRDHNKTLETDPDLAITKMQSLQKAISEIKNDFSLSLKVNYHENEQYEQTLNSSYYRELQYNIEHAIHHMAIVKIALQHSFKAVELPAHFGVAYSTVRYQKELTCAQ
ncbi:MULTISPECIES: hypothetical protein [Roseivirga]|jgi:uncharacterized damage-inducible protein DinB|uniref:hypothetical protein n=1 Tax=Roseivirga TaxID=290180 RepID=UPI00257DA891|nr:MULTISPECIES: hypothetical protein [Roseivirga]MEC7755073.1 hypothetical protein [Bacteroidota bacterium]|tara:strand:- start:2471 stop:2986 length:516 start_codon:yes stop_codon:yes gene_type:complete